jgi:branched-chain amino acid aminotransferase
MAFFRWWLPSREKERPMPNYASHVWFNGTLIDSRDATLHVLTPALHYGIGVFEGIRAYDTARGPAIFRLDEHIHRLMKSASILGFRDLPFGFEPMKRACLDLVRTSGFGDCYIRPLIYLAEGGWNLELDGGVPHSTVTAWEWNAYLGEAARQNGVRANVSSFTRHHPNVMMTKAKISGNYVSSFLAKTESRRLGFDEAIMLDPNGYVAECTGENIFVVKDGQVFTPPLGAILDGITRASIITIAADQGYPVKESPIGRDALYAADEVFVCGTAAEVVGLREIDFRQIGAGTVGPVTRRLQEVYHDAVRGLRPGSEPWLSYVVPEAAGGRLSADAPAA